MILIINLSTKFSTPQDKNLANYPSKKTHLRLKENAEEF